MAQCTNCWGSGYAGDCYICNGSGRTPSPDGTYVTGCSSCGGSGKRRCPTCNGSGQVADSSSSSSGSSYSSPSSSSSGGGGSNEYDRIRSQIGDAVYKAQAGDYDGAIAAYTRIIDYCKPRSSYGGTISGQMKLAYFNMGVAYSRKGDWDNAIINFKNGIGASSVASGLNEYFAIGEAYKNKKDYDNAIEYYTKSINSRENCITTSYNNRGICYAKKGNEQQAIADFKRSADWNSVHNDEDAALQNLKNRSISYTPETPPEIIQERQERAERQAREEAEEKRSRIVSILSPFAIVDRDGGEGSTFIFGVVIAAIGLSLGYTFGGWIACIIAGIVGWVIGSQVIGPSIQVKLLKLILYIILLSALASGVIYLINGISTSSFGSVFTKTDKTRTVQSSTETTATVTADSLNLRAGPSSSHDIIKTLSKGDTLTVTGTIENGWVPVKHENDTGYVSSNLISLSTASNIENSGGDE